jgi:hypothetical protein
MKPENSWVRYLLSRIKKNQNNLIVVVGATGSGKSYACLKIGELMSEKNGVPFTDSNIVFGLKELLKLINSGKLKKGSVILFDEPQCSISAREFQSLANKTFNYLISTFRHRCFTVLMATPYEDLLDISSRKLFHAKFLTTGIDRKEKKVILKPLIMQYNSHKQKFYEKFLRVSFREENSPVNTILPLRNWSIPKPSEELIKLYEQKKLKFTTNLNEHLEKRLEAYEKQNEIKDKRKPLTDKQLTVLITLARFKGNVKRTALALGLQEYLVYFHNKQAKKKDYSWEEYVMSENTK